VRVLDISFVLPCARMASIESTLAHSYTHALNASSKQHHTCLILFGSVSLSFHHKMREKFPLPFVFVLPMEDV